MGSIDLKLIKTRHFGLHTFELTTRSVLYAFGWIGMLVILDQATKMYALASAPTALQAIAETPINVAIGWHIHQPNAQSANLAIFAIGLVGAFWFLPVPMAAKILWTAAALSNHLEMLLRPGTVDFVAVRLNGNICVANVADFYVLTGIAIVMTAMYNLIKATPSWFSPVRI